jgi:exodeoxyribonuclease V gamma subunit
MLNQLQDDILELRPLNETRERWPAVDLETDQSIRFHIAHSAQREVEILHDQLLARFSADADLRPRDVIVMVPDIDSYAPHIRAVFGQLDRHDPRFIPFTLADQGQRGRDPLLIAVEHLLKLPDSRFLSAKFSICWMSRHCALASASRSVICPPFTAGLKARVFAGA